MATYLERIDASDPTDVKRRFYEICDCVDDLYPLYEQELSDGERPAQTAGELRLIAALCNALATKLLENYEKEEGNE